MNQVDLTGFPLFDNFCEFEIGKDHIDLHNDFNCTGVEFSKQSKEVILDFIYDESAFNPFKQVTLIFRDVIIDTFDFQLSDDYEGIWTVDMLYRERIETEDGSLVESLDGRNYYHIGFYEDYTIELFASSVIAQIIHQ